MKYGILIHNNDSNLFFKNSDSAIVNLGDYVQSIGVQYAYNLCKINDKEIQFIEKYSLTNYKGDRMAVVLNNVFSGGGVVEKIPLFPTAENIIPIFIGFNCHDVNLIKSNIAYFKEWEPIGCRDEKTKLILLENGVEAYVTGCSSILYPKRKEADYKKIFLVDVDFDLKQYIPKEYLEDTKCVSQNIFENSISNKDALSFYRLTNEYMEMYRNEAKVVITSKLHCAAPCLGMEIPVILVKKNIDYRFSWIDKLIPIYDNLEKVDWSIRKYDCEHAKELLINVYKSIINKYDNVVDYIDRNPFEELDKYYCNRERSNYNSEVINIIKRAIRRFQGRRIECLIWGAGRTGGLVYDIIKEEIQDINIVAFIDTYKEGYFKNRKIIKPDDIGNMKFDYIFLCSLPGRIDCEMKMNSLGMKEHIEYEKVYFEDKIYAGN